MTTPTTPSRDVLIDVYKAWGGDIVNTTTWPKDQYHMSVYDHWSMDETKDDTAGAYEGSGADIATFYYGSKEYHALDAVLSLIQVAKYCPNGATLRGFVISRDEFNTIIRVCHEG